MVTDKQIDEAVLEPTVERCAAVILGLLEENGGTLPRRALAEHHIGVPHNALLAGVWREARDWLVASGHLELMAGRDGEWTVTDGSGAGITGRQIEIVGALRRAGGSASSRVIADDLGIHQSALYKPDCLWAKARRALVESGAVVADHDGLRLVDGGE